MHKFTPSKQILLVCSGVIALVIIGVTITALARHHTANPISVKNTAVKHPNSSTTTHTSATTTNTPTNPVTKQTSSADKQTAAAAAKPITEACALLTLDVARKLLGSGTQTSTPGDTSTYQATDTNVTACAYANGSSNVQLVVRTPTSSLGTSENDTVFGSDRPSGATTVQGYGQSAYWDSSAHTLNILGNNNWYIITRNSNTESSTEAVATQLAAGF